MATSASVCETVVAPRAEIAPVAADHTCETASSELLAEFSASWHSGISLVQRRARHRFVCDLAGVLAPIDEESQSPLGEACEVRVKNLSKFGVGISHRQPMPHRLVLLEYHTARGAIVRAIVRLKWCRFKGAGLYESGGPIVRLLPEGAAGFAAAPDDSQG